MKMAPSVQNNPYIHTPMAATKDIHRLDVALILGRIMDDVERAVTEAHGDPDVHTPALAALRLLKQAQKVARSR